MHEVFPLASGVVIALFVARVVPVRLRAVVLAVLCVTFGLMASAISGELAVSWAFVLIDTGFVFGAALVTTLLLAGWRRRSIGRG